MLSSKRISYEGYNMAMIQEGDGFLATMRRVRGRGPGESFYPELFNTTHVLTLDADFNVKDTYALDEKVDWGQQKHVSFCDGMEDCRFIDNRSLICVAHGTNPNWITKTAYAEFSHEEKRLTRFVPLRVKGRDMETEKNWLFLRKVDENRLHFLHWYSPFQVIELDLTTGNAEVIKSYQKEGIQLNSHGGSCLFLEEEQKYLVTVRHYKDRKYVNNTWLLFDTNYDLCGMSEGFLFDVSTEISTVPTYQMVMSLIRKDGFLYASVSTDDSIVMIYKMDLAKVLESIVPV
jgi:hypothetical protein